MKNKFEIVIEKLKLEGFEPEIIIEKLSDNNNYTSIVWRDEVGRKYEVDEFEITWDGGNNLAWFLDEEPRLVIYENGEKEIRQVGESLNFWLIYLEWYKGSLILVNKGKHNTFISSYKNKELSIFSFHGEFMNRKGDLISYDTFTNKLKGKTRLIKIPELIELEPISNTEAKERGLFPKDLRDMMYDLGDD